jgi:hypothetical protein
MKKNGLILFISTWCGIISAQDITYNKHIAPIIKNHCLACHRQNGAAPFSLETYDQVCKNNKLIAYVVANHIMPPWSLDTSEHLFKNERVLSPGEINTISTWIKNTMPVGSGKPVKLKYKAPARDAVKPDMIIKFPKPYKISADNKDLLVTYLQKIDVGEDKYLSKIEIVPGNKRLLHHCRVDFDTSGGVWTKDVDKDGFIGTLQIPELPMNGPVLKFVGTYVPGLAPYEYPEWAGLKLFRKMTIMVGLHYSSTSIPEYDDTEVRLYFCKKKPEREVFNRSDLVVFYRIVDLGLYVPKNTIYCIDQKSEPLVEDISLIGIQPHMHLLGQTMNINAITPRGDTIDLCRVAKWNYKEQENYYYKKLVKIPSGSVFEVHACYDNTVNNTQNPFFPPRDVYFYLGMTSENEMIEYYIQYLKYQDGDETKDTIDK